MPKLSERAVLSATSEANVIPVDSLFLLGRKTFSFLRHRCFADWGRKHASEKAKHASGNIRNASENAKSACEHAINAFAKAKHVSEHLRVLQQMLSMRQLMLPKLKRTQTSYPQQAELFPFHISKLIVRLSWINRLFGFESNTTHNN